MQRMAVRFLLVTLISLSTPIPCTFGIWNYSNPNQDWPNLPCTHTCSGSLQSPVDIRTSFASPDLKQLNLVGYEDANVTLTNKGYTIEIEFPEEYRAHFKEGHFLKQFHFHTPAENDVVDAKYVLTMHMVHKSAEGGIAVLTFLWDVKEYPTNAWLDPVIQSLQNVTSPGSQFPIFLYGLDQTFEKLKQTSSNGYYNFLGSLTTPPCTEGVDWYVMDTRFQLSRAQYDALHALMGSNYRPIQRYLHNVTAYVPQLTFISSPTQLPIQSPTPTPTPTPSPSPQSEITSDHVNDVTYFNGFWVVLALLIVTLIALLVSLFFLKKHFFVEMFKREESKPDVQQE